MGYVNQVTSPSADSARLTISMFAKTPPSADAYLMQWGHQPGINFDDETPSSYIWISNDPSNLEGLGLGNRLQIQLTGIWDSVLAADNLSSTDQAIDGLYEDLTNNSDSGCLYTPYMWAEINQLTDANLASDFGPDKWFHLLFSCDLSSNVNVGSEGNPFIICINGTVRSLDLSANPGMAVAAQAIKQSLVATAIPTADDHLPGDWPFSVTHASTMEGGGTVTTTGVVPASPIAFSGLEIGFPKQAAFAALPVESDDGPSDPTNANPVRMADILVWVGQFIDPRTQIDKFLTDGRPVDPAVAVDAFGTPDYWLSGDKTAFLTNRGTAGPLGLTGTINNYAPPPAEPL